MSLRRRITPEQDGSVSGLGSIVLVGLLLCFRVPILAEPRELPESKVAANGTDALLSFRPPVRASAQCFYGLEHGKPTDSVVTIVAHTNIELMLTGLSPGRIYYYQAGFYGTNSELLYYRNSAFRTSGHPELRLDSIEVEPEQYGATIRGLVSAGMNGRILFEGVEYPLVESGKRIVPRLMGMSEELTVYQTSIKNAKPGKKYTFRLVGNGNQGAKINHESSFQTVENNVALHKPVTGTFSGTFIADNYQLEGDILSRVTDGSFEYKTGMAVSTDPNLSDQWVVVDLQKEYPLDAVICYWRAIAYPLEFDLSLSVDGVTWTSTRTVKGDQERMVMATMPVQVSRAAFDGETARYVRIFFLKGGKYFRRFDSYRFLQLVELKVLPKE